MTVRPGRLGEIDEVARGNAARETASFESEIRDFVRKDASFARQPRAEPTAGDAAAENVNTLIRRVAGASLEEIDRVILELQGVRDILRKEGERVQHEIGGYAGLSQAAMTMMKVIGDSLAQWKSSPPIQPDGR